MAAPVTQVILDTPAADFRLPVATAVRLTHSTTTLRAKRPRLSSSSGTFARKSNGDRPHGCGRRRADVGARRVLRGVI
jgi:hypothetical protein